VRIFLLIFPVENTPEAGLEVNGSESASNWKLLRFLDCDEYQEYEENNTYLESGDIVRIIHKKTGDTLTVPPKSLEPMISVRYFASLPLSSNQIQ